MDNHNIKWCDIKIILTIFEETIIIKTHKTLDLTTAKNILVSLLAISTLTMAGCNSGGSSGKPAAANPYAITNYNLTTDSQTNCAMNDSSEISCNSNALIAAFYKVTFVEPNSGAGAYVLVPPTGNTYGVTVASTGCDQTAGATGTTYTCNFNLTGNNVQSGNTFPIQITGDLGAYNLITVKLESVRNFVL